MSRKVLVFAAAAAWSSYILASVLGQLVPGWFTWILELVASTWIGVLFLLFVCVLAADLVTGFGYLLPGIASRLRGAAFLAGIVLSVIALVQGTRAPMIRSYDVALSGLPRQNDGTVVVLASDMHLGTLLGPGWLAARVDQINAQRPDLVVLAGDIVEGHGGNPQEFLPVLRRLSAPMGVWAVNGNHEGYGRPTDRLLSQAGVQVLRDRWAQVRPGLILAGVDDLTSRRRRLGHDAEFVDHAMAGRPAGAATIFVSHTPWRADRAASQGAGLMLSGHTHNGQIWPFNYFVRISYPLLAGRYDVSGMPVIVSRGTGTWGPRMRLWSRGEIVRITLHPARQLNHAPEIISRVPARSAATFAPSSR
jgi:predicted MPP superfamily phosphohydrolase